MLVLLVLVLGLEPSHGMNAPNLCTSAALLNILESRVRVRVRVRVRTSARIRVRVRV